MIPPHQAQINWAEIGVVIAGISVFVGVIGWFVIHKLTVRREKAQRKERVLRAISDFEITINKWEKAINDTHVPRNQVWTVTLSGGLDLYVRAINEVRTASIEDAESYLRAIRPLMNANGKSRLDKAWQDYQGYNIEGRDAKDAETGQEFTSHIECKSELIGCLSQLKTIVQEIEI